MTITEKLSNWAFRYSRKHEHQTDYDGFLSYAGEFHALTLGLATGFASIVAGEPKVAALVILATIGVRGSGTVARQLAKIGKKREDSTALGELRREPWYAVGGVIIGVVGGTGILVILGQPVPDVGTSVFELLEYLPRIAEALA